MCRNGVAAAADNWPFGPIAIVAGLPPPPLPLTGNLLACPSIFAPLLSPPPSPGLAFPARLRFKLCLCLARKSINALNELQKTLPSPLPARLPATPRSFHAAHTKPIYS